MTTRSERSKRNTETEHITSRHWNIGTPEHRETGTPEHRGLAARTGRGLGATCRAGQSLPAPAYDARMASDASPAIRIERATGAAIEGYLDVLAALRIRVFREYPYLYDGSLAYEQEYLASYAG